MMYLGEVIDNRLSVALLAAWIRWLEVGISQGGRVGEGVVMFARREEVEVAREDEEAASGIRIHMSGVFQDGVLNSEYLRGREAVVMDVPVHPTETFITRHNTKYSPRDKIILSEDSLGTCRRT